MLQRSLSASRLLSRGGVFRRGESYRASSSSSSGGSNPMSVAAAVGSAGVGGVVGYAFFDPEFRSSLEKNVPGASEVFSTLFGSAPAKPPPPAAAVTPPSKVKVTRVPEPEVIEPPKKAHQLTSNKPDKAAKKAVESSPSPPSNADASFKKQMASLASLMKETASATIFSNEATMSHLKLLQEAMEGSEDREESNSWDKVFNAATLKREANKKASELIDKSNQSIKDLVNLVDAGKKELEANGRLEEAEKGIQNAIENLQTLNDKMVEAAKNAKLVDEFRDLVEKGKKALQLEFSSILPPGGPETKEDFDLFIQHAYKKILTLQMDLAKQKTLEQQKFGHFLEDLKAEKNVDIQQAVQSALDAQRLEFEKEKIRVQLGEHERMEAELRVHLKRQAAAHFDHLNDSKTVQEAELSRSYERKLHESLLSETNSQKAKMSEMMGAYEGLVSALEKRGKADENILHAQNLWLSATNLYQCVVKGGIPLKPAVDELKRHVSSSEDKAFVDTVLKSLDPVSLERGVLAEEEMRSRFLKVQRLSQVTAMIGPEGASPLVYLLSYIQSKFIRSTSEQSVNSSDLDSLDTSDIVGLARFSLDRGNLEMAVKYMTLLKGLPKNIARDWIMDARRVLEVKQAAEAIIAQASSSAVQFPAQ